jgi:hypothetical protein
MRFYIYIYIYIKPHLCEKETDREREREREREKEEESLCKIICKQNPNLNKENGLMLSRDSTCIPMPG